VVLFRGGGPLVKRERGAALHMDRAPEYRVGAGPNADRPLGSRWLKLLLRPLHGNHL
jgi:hypothetical protein